MHRRSLLSLLASLGSFTLAVGCSSPPRDDAASTSAALVLATCGGTPRMPTAGPLPFVTGERVTYSRTCDAFGECTEWTQASHDTLSARVFDDPSIGNDAVLRPDGSFSIRAKVEGSSSLGDQGGGVSAACYDYEYGYGDVDPATGVGHAKLETDEACRLVGGYGSGDEEPGHSGPQRDVDVKLGSSCIAFTDVQPAVAAGTQHRSVVRLSWKSAPGAGAATDWNALLRCDGAVLDVDAAERRHLQLVVRDPGAVAYLSAHPGAGDVGKTPNGKGELVLEGFASAGAFTADQFAGMSVRVGNGAGAYVERNADGIEARLVTTEGGQERETANWVFRNCH